MKKTMLFGIIILSFVAISGAATWRVAEIIPPEIPSDYKDLTKWLMHPEICKPAGKWYVSTAYARITDDKKVESVLTTSLDGTIFRYRHDKGNGGPDFIIDFIKTETGWVRLDVLSESGYEKTQELVEKYLFKHGVSLEDYGTACAKILQSGFGRFWDNMFKKLHEEQQLLYQ